ncbi:MAG: hypothetical protein ABSG25_16335 [Bryobacteraceae bacterium]
MFRCTEQLMSPELLNNGDDVTASVCGDAGFVMSIVTISFGVQTYASVPFSAIETGAVGVVTVLSNVNGPAVFGVGVAAAVLGATACAFTVCVPGAATLFRAGAMCAAEAYAGDLITGGVGVACAAGELAAPSAWSAAPIIIAHAIQARLAVFTKAPRHPAAP